MSRRNTTNSCRRAQRAARWAACVSVVAASSFTIRSFAGTAGGHTPPTQTEPAGAPLDWANAVVQGEIAILNQQGTFSVRYREHKVDAKGDTTREIIESKEGGVARLLERNGKPITPEEDAAERERLEDAIKHPEDFLRHHRHDAGNRNDVIEQLKLMPQAMIYSYAAGQPQLPAAKSEQVVVDFEPNPKWHPPTMISELLTGLAGRVWIDPETKRATRVEARVLHPVNFGFGILAKIYPGGTIVFEQKRTEDGHWVYAHVDEHLNVRALMVKSLPEATRMDSSHVEMLPSLLSYQDAIRMLLAMPSPAK
jgi:hypothetical protein